MRHKHVSESRKNEATARNKGGSEANAKPDQAEQHQQNAPIASMRWGGWEANKNMKKQTATKTATTRPTAAKAEKPKSSHEAAGLYLLPRLGQTGGLHKTPDRLFLQQ